MNPVFRHPALWATAAILAGGIVFQAGRANAAPAAMTAMPPIAARQVSSFTEGNLAPAAGAAMTLKQLDTQFADLVEEVGRSVVHIRTENGNMQGQGSGVIVREDGWIVTNDHVVNGAKDVTVILANGREYKGRVIESNDDRNDLAVVKIEAKKLPVATFADSSRVRPGEYAIAVGAPFGLENTVTIGHISATGRMNAAGGATGEVRTYSNMIQTDAPINPGNSGGPLLNIDGEIVGINSSIYSGSMVAANAGIGFAIPSNQVKFVADLLINNKTLKRGYLNISMDTLKPYELEEKHLPGGIRVVAVMPNGAAAKADLKKDDIITKIGSYSIHDDQDLLNAMLRYAPGETVSIQIVRNGVPKSQDIKIDAKLMQPVAQNEPRVDQDERGNPFGFEMPEGGIDQWFDRLRNRGGDEPQPRQDRKVGEPAKLGVQVTDINSDSRKTFQLPENAKGGVVMSVEPNSVASRIGLEPGDVLTQLGDKLIKNAADLVSAVKGFKVGDTTMVSFTRYSNGNTMQMSQTVAF